MTSGNKGDGSSLARSTDQPVKLVIRDGWGRVLEGSGLMGRCVSFVLLLVLAVGSGALLGPRAHQVIPYDADDVGRFAVGTLKAHRNYRIEDREATENKRREARENVLAVYDYDADAREQTVRRVRGAFDFMRETWNEHRLEVAARVERSASSPVDGYEQDERLASASDLPTEYGAADEEGAEFDDLIGLVDDARALEFLREHMDSFLQRLQLPLDDTSFDVLARQRFSIEMERALVQLVRHGMSRPIISDRQLIPPDHMRGIIVRPVPVRGARSERTVGDVAGEVRDLPIARAVLNEAVADLLPSASPGKKAEIVRLARRLVLPTLIYNHEETERRREEAEASVRATFIELEAGEKIIGDGERIEPRHLLIFEGIRQQAATASTLEAQVGAGLLALLIVLTLFSFARGGVWRFRPSRKDLLFLLTILLGTLLIVRGGMFLGDALADRMPGVSGAMLYFAIPAGAAVVLVRLVLSAETTLVFAVALSALVGVVADASIGFALFTFVGGIVAAQHVGRARDRSGVWRAGVLMAVINVLVVAALVLQQNGELTESYPSLLSAAIAGAVTPVLVLGLTILVENVFRYMTDLKLLELANMNNALLKDLVVAAPGTYHHSMMLGSMVESAAEAIGANPLFARVGAYYHDIGKGKNPLYFAENQKGDNPHEKLSPSMSVLIIRRHVADGIKIARAAGLPQPLIDMIPMHHGTRQLAYFWQKAKDEAERKGESAPAETDFRYTGPKPRFREAALLMIADSVEAAARSLTEPTTDRLRGLVQKVINACFADGQFDECNITLKDLHAITRSFVRSLEAIHHSRPEYQQPADKTLEKTRNGDKIKQEKLREKTAKSQSASTEREVDSIRDGEHAGSEEGSPSPEKKRSNEVSVAASVPQAAHLDDSAVRDGAHEDKHQSGAIDEEERGQSLENGDSLESEDEPDSKVEALKRLGTG